MEADQSISQNDSQSSTTEDHQRIKSESVPGDAPYLTTQALALDPAHFKTTASASPQPIIPSTETSHPVNGVDSPSMADSAGARKKGTATAMKRAPKRAKIGKGRKKAKKAKPEPTSNAGSEVDQEEDQEEDGDSDAGSDDEESDHGPYCICRGPDDHRWMICCEKCEDWFHGERIKPDKTIGESLIEKFICPNCTDDTICTLYKKTCALGALTGCRKPSRLVDKKGAPAGDSNRSAFCSPEHAAMWWERVVARLPKGKANAGLSDQLTQDEFMALLSHGMIGPDDQGIIGLLKTPFKDADGDVSQPAYLEDILTTEEKEFLDHAANRRADMANETVLCHQMLKLIEFAQDRRRRAIDARVVGEDVCGYDNRLDTISSRDAFAAFMKSDEGSTIFANESLGSVGPTTNGNTTNGGGAGSLMCERKRCKAHIGWHKILVTGIKHQIKEMSALARELIDDENNLREAAQERHLRKKAESNWVEVIDA